MMLKKIKTILLGLIVFFGLIGVAKAESRYLQNLKKVSKVKEITPGKSADLLGIVLDSEVFDQTDSDYSDIRIVGEDRNEIPFIVKPRLGSVFDKRAHFCKSKILSLKKLPENKIEIVVENKEKTHIPDRLSIVTKMKNYEKLVTVFGSDDQKDWQELAKNQQIYDYSEIVKLNRRVVPLPKEKYLFYKVIISNFTEDKTSPTMKLVKETRMGEDFSRIEKIVKTKEPLKIDGILLVATIKVELKKANQFCEYPVTFEEEKSDSKNTSLIITTSRQPLVNFDFETVQQNFYRKVILSGSDDLKSWRTILNSQIYSIAIAKSEKSDRSVSFPEFRFKYYRVKIINGDAQPVKVTGIKAKGNIYQAELLSTGIVPEKLGFYFSGENIPVPKYDIEAIISELKKPTIAYCQLEPANDNPDFTGKAKDSMGWLNNKTILFIVIGVMVVILALVLAKHLKKIEMISDNEEN